MEHMKLTIKKIAELAGVSRGTVDRALNNRAGVNPEVAKKIQNIAKELEYKPDMAAKILATKRYSLNTIGILLNSEENPFYEEVTRGVETAMEEAKQFGTTCILKTMKGYDVATQLKKIEELLAENVVGIVMTPINSRRITNKINELAERDIPVVAINTDAEESRRLAYVGCEYIQSGKVGAGLLGMLAGGKAEKIGIIGGSKYILAQDKRIFGLMDTIVRDFPNITVLRLIENDDNEQFSYELTKEMLQTYPMLTGVCFVAGGVAGGLKAIKELKKENQLKIVTYDLTDTVKVNLLNNTIAATVCQEPYKQGYLGVDILTKYLFTGNKPEQDTIYTENSIVMKYSLK